MSINLKKLKKGIYSGFGTKGIGFGLQVIALPTVAKVLSSNDFALFLLIISVPSFVMLGQLGAGPSLTRRVAHAFSKGDWRQISTVVSASNALSLLIGILILIISVLIIKSQILLNLINDTVHLNSGLDYTFYIAVAISVLSLIAAPFLRAQIGVHESYINNICGAVGSGAGVVLLLGVLPFFPSLSMAVIAYCAAPVVGSTIGAAAFIWKYRNLCPLRFILPWREWKSALSDGISFTIFETGQALSREGVKFFILSSAGALSLATYGGIVQIAMIGRAIFLLIGIPGLAYISDLIAKGDLKTCETILKRVAASGIILAIVISLLAYFFGGNVFHILFSKFQNPTPYEMVAGALFGVSICYKSAMMLYVTALGKPWPAAIASVVESIFIVAVVGLVNVSNSFLALLTQAIAIIALSGVSLTVYAFKKLKNEENYGCRIEDPA